MKIVLDNNGMISGHRTASPLRYPGGKSSLSGLFENIIKQLGLDRVTYVEPYAGGAGAGITLLQNKVVDHLVINDLDSSVFAFWRSVLHQTEAFLEKLESTPLTIPEWLHQRTIYRSKSSDLLELGFSFFYLNRTNRSGILTGGVIGGLAQQGSYLMDARFNRKKLANRIRRLSGFRDQITVTNLDGRLTILEYATNPDSFLYIDPPYVKAGKGLYLNSFDYYDHSSLARILKDNRSANWILTYDDHPTIEALYQDFNQLGFSLNYSATNVAKANELMIAADPIVPFLIDHGQELIAQ